MYAAEMGHDIVVEYLLECGADTESANLVSPEIIMHSNSSCHRSVICSSSDAENYTTYIIVLF